MKTIKDKFTTCHWCFQSNLISIWKYSKSSLITSSALSQSWNLRYHSFSIVGIVNWVFHVWDNLRLFMISFKYGLILLRYYSVGDFYFDRL